MAFSFFFQIELKVINWLKPCWSWLVPSYIRLHNPDKHLWPTKSCDILFVRLIYQVVQKRANLNKIIDSNLQCLTVQNFIPNNFNMFHTNFNQEKSWKGQMFNKGYCVIEFILQWIVLQVMFNASITGWQIILKDIDIEEINICINFLCFFVKYYVGTLPPKMFTNNFFSKKPSKLVYTWNNSQ